jgi:hypothetical protein
MTKLGGLSPVIEEDASKLFEEGRFTRPPKRTASRAQIAAADRSTNIFENGGRAVKGELESIRLRQDKLRRRPVELEGMLRDSREWLGLGNRHFRDALSVSLELMGASSLTPLSAEEAVDNEERHPLGKFQAWTNRPEPTPPGPPPLIPCVSPANVARNLGSGVKKPPSVRWYFREPGNPRMATLSTSTWNIA